MGFLEKKTPKQSVTLGALFPDIDTAFGIHRKTFHNLLVLGGFVAFPLVFDNLRYVWIGIHATSSTPPENSTDTDPDHATEQPRDESDNEDEREADTSPSPELHQLKATLEDEGLAATVEEDDTLTVERLGQTYRIRPGEEIEGDGALRSQLETIVADAT